MKPNVIIINAKDNVAIALGNIKAGESVLLPEGGSFPARSDIEFSHKVLLGDLKAGDKIIKYGEVIGHAAADSPKGEWIHTHNMTFREDES